MRISYHNPIGRHTELECGLTSHLPASIVQRCKIIEALIDHLPHVNSISNSLTNSGDVSVPTSIKQILCRHIKFLGQTYGGGD